MQVQVEDALSGVLTYVENKPVATIQCLIGSKPEVLGYPAGYEEHVSYQKFILFRDLLNTKHVFLGDYKNMNGSDRVYVVEGVNEIIFINLFGRYFPVYYLAKDAVLSHRKILNH